MEPVAFNSFYKHRKLRLCFLREEYALVVHCGGCMLNEREMKYRINSAADSRIPITNYGIAIAKMNGILERSVKPLGI